MLLLDEPFAGLAAGTRKRLEADLRLLAREEDVAILLSDAASGPLGWPGDLLLPIAGGRIHGIIPNRSAAECRAGSFRNGP